MRRALRTLVVEDDAMIGALLAETLEGLGHAVCAVESNVTNAVAAASHWRPDLIIVDVGHSEASGVAAIKEIVRTNFVPHVFVTGDVVTGMPLGPKSCPLTKAFSRVGSGTGDSRGARNGAGYVTASPSEVKRTG